MIIVDVARDVPSERFILLIEMNTLKKFALIAFLVSFCLEETRSNLRTEKEVTDADNSTSSVILLPSQTLSDTDVDKIIQQCRHKFVRKGNIACIGGVTSFNSLMTEQGRGCWSDNLCEFGVILEKGPATGLGHFIRLTLFMDIRNPFPEIRYKNLAVKLSFPHPHGSTAHGHQLVTPFLYESIELFDNEPDCQRSIYLKGEKSKEKGGTFYCGVIPEGKFWGVSELKTTAQEQKVIKNRMVSVDKYALTPIITLTSGEKTIHFDVDEIEVSLVMGKLGTPIIHDFLSGLPVPAVKIVRVIPFSKGNSPPSRGKNNGMGSANSKSKNKISWWWLWILIVVVVIVILGIVGKIMLKKSEAYQSPPIA